MKRYWKLKELSELTGIKHATLAKWCREGRIAGAKRVFGGNWLIDLAELREDEDNLADLFDIPEES